MNVGKLAAWLRERLMTPPLVVSVVLWHVDGDELEEVHAEPVVGGKSQQVARMLAEAIAAKAQDHAEEVEGGRFAVGLRGKRGDRPDRHVLTVRSGALIRRDEQAVERVKDERDQALLAAYGRIDKMQRERDRALAEREKEMLPILPQLFRMFCDMAAAHQVAMDHEHDREMERAEYERKSQRDALLLNMLVGALPRLLGGKPDAANLQGQLQQFVGQMSPEQREALMGSLSPEQQASLATMIGTEGNRDERTH